MGCNWRWIGYLVLVAHFLLQPHPSWTLPPADVTDLIAQTLNLGRFRLSLLAVGPLADGNYEISASESAFVSKSELYTHVTEIMEQVVSWTQGKEGLEPNLEDGLKGLLDAHAQEAGLARIEYSASPRLVSGLQGIEARANYHNRGQPITMRSIIFRSVGDVWRVTVYFVQDNQKAEKLTDAIFNSVKITAFSQTTEQSTAAEQPGVPPVAERAYSSGAADTRLESFDARLRRGEGQAVHAAVLELVSELGAAGAEDGRLAAALRALALAEAGIGRGDEAVWHWQAAQNLRPGLLMDPAAYGEAGALLARHTLRRRDEAPAGMEAIMANNLGAGSTPPRKIAGDEPKIPGFLASSRVPRWARLQVVIDTEGRVVEPVVLAGRSEIVRLAALEAVRTWRFEPARREGKPVAVLLDVDLPPRAGTPLAEMIPLSGEARIVHALLLKQEWREARAKAADLVRTVGEEGQTDPRQQAAALALLALADAGSDGRSSTCYWHAAQSLYGDLYHATLAAYGTAGALLEESNPWVQNEEIFRVGSSPWAETVLRPEKIRGGPPQFPTRDRRAHVRGVIILQIVVEKDGRVTQPQIRKGLSPGLDVNTLVALCEWRFKPATSSGRPVRVYYELTMNFAAF